jgi:phosphotriesterase-related protein
MSSEFRSPRLTRRETLRLLGLGAAAAALPDFASAAAPSYPKGAVIRTVLKDYAPEDLAGGATLFHEHLSTAPDFMVRWNKFAMESRIANGQPIPQRPAGAAPPAPPPPTKVALEDLEGMAEELRIAKNEGISCIVDGGHADMGRQTKLLKQLSEKSGLPIVSGGGFYTQPFYPKEITTMSEEQIFQALLKQADTEQIGVFGEIGSWDDITKDERKVFRAIGRASAATNLSIFTHTGIPGKSAMEQLDILEDAGAIPGKIVIGHLGNLSQDQTLYVHKAICKRGAFIGFDRQGGNGDATQVAMVMKLLEAGYADNLMFSADLSSPGQLKQNGGGGYAKTLTVFVPKLKAAGASDDVLKAIMNDNPRRFLAFVPKKPRKG